MIQIGNVSTYTEIEEYWDEDFFREVEFVDSTMDKERTAFVARSESVEEVIEKADYDRFIVVNDPDLMYDHPEADVKVEAYDGHNE